MFSNPARRRRRYLCRLLTLTSEELVQHSFIRISNDSEDVTVRASVTSTINSGFQNDDKWLERTRLGLKSRRCQRRHKCELSLENIRSSMTLYAGAETIRVSSVSWCSFDYCFNFLSYSRASHGIMIYRKRRTNYLMRDRKVSSWFPSWSVESGDPQYDIDKEYNLQLLYPFSYFLNSEISFKSFWYLSINQTWSKIMINN